MNMPLLTEMVGILERPVSYKHVAPKGLPKQFPARNFEVIELPSGRQIMKP